MSAKHQAKSSKICQSLLEKDGDLLQLQYTYFSGQICLTRLTKSCASDADFYTV